MRSDSSSVPRRNSLSNSLHPEGVSTHHPSVRQKSTEDGELYIAGQGLVPVVNNPAAMHRSTSGSYGLLSWPASAVDKAWAEASIPAPSALHREVSYSDFDVYRTRVGTLMDRYMHRRMSVQQDNARRLSAADPEGKTPHPCHNEESVKSRMWVLKGRGTGPGLAPSALPVLPGGFCVDSARDVQSSDQGRDPRGAQLHTGHAKHCLS